MLGVARKLTNHNISYVECISISLDNAPNSFEVRIEKEKSGE